MIYFLIFCGVFALGVNLLTDEDTDYDMWINLFSTSSLFFFQISKDVKSIQRFIKRCLVEEICCKATGALVVERWVLFGDSKWLKNWSPLMIFFH